MEHNTDERIEPPASLAAGCRNKARLNPIVRDKGVTRMLYDLCECDTGGPHIGQEIP